MRITLLLISLLVCPLVNAQYNSKLDDSTEAISLVKNQYIKVPTSINNFYKVGLGTSLVQSSISNNFKGFSIDAFIERRVWKNIFITFGLETNYSFGDKVEMLNIYMPVGLRQYISFNKKRMDCNGIFRTYVALQTHNSLYSTFFYNRDRIDLDRYYRGSKQSSIVNSGQYIEGPNLLEYIYFRLGHQFKIGKSSYLDISTIIPIKPLTYSKNVGGFTLASPALIGIKYGLVLQNPQKTY